MSISPACHPDKTGPALVPVPGGESVTCSDGLPEGADPGSPGDAPKSCIGHTTLTHQFLSAPDQAYCNFLLGNASQSVVRSRLNGVSTHLIRDSPPGPPVFIKQPSDRSVCTQTSRSAMCGKYFRRLGLTKDAP